MGSPSIIPASIGLLWAGMSLGGSLIAAPAKFRAPSLDFATALEVGQAQFRWLSYAEWTLFLALLSALILAGRIVDWKWFALPLLIFLLQQFAIMPRLDAITENRIAGNVTNSGYFHITYIAAELLKFLSLTIVSFTTFKTLIE